MELDRFQVLKSYAESIKTLAKWDELLARELAYRVIMYWIYGAEPPVNSNPILLALFNQMKLPIQKCRAKWWNAVKNWEKVWNQIEIKWNSNGNQNEITWVSNDNQSEIKPEQNIKYKNKKEKNNSLTAISWTEVQQENEKKSYWNEDVNKCLTLIKTFNHWVMNGSDSNNRKQAWNLINKLKTFDSVVKWDYKRDEVLEWILTVISQNEYYRWKIGSPKLIYDNLWTLVQVCWKETSKLKQRQETSLELI